MPATTPIVSSGTRERILSFLQVNKTVTVPEISQAWSLTRADVRYHLNLLVKDGIVEVTDQDGPRAAQRGRPVLHYRLASHLADNNLPELCSALLDLYLTTMPGEQSERILQTLVLHITAELPVSLSPISRLNQAVAYLNRRHYQARWEASPTGPRLLLRNCPYAVILKRHPELCEFDRLLINRVCHLSVKQTARMDLITGRPSTCIFTT